MEVDHMFTVLVEVEQYEQYEQCEQCEQYEQCEQHEQCEQYEQCECFRAELFRITGILDATGQS